MFGCSALIRRVRGRNKVSRSTLIKREESDSKANPAH